MLRSELYDIKETLDQVCKAIVSVLDVDITVVDNEYRRISGTGRYANSLGEVLNGIGVFEHALITRKSKIVENPREHEICIPCEYKEECEEFAQVCCPIVYEESVIGVMGVAAFECEQKKRLLSNKESMLNFVENMALLIVSKVKEHSEARKVAVMAGELRLLFNTMDHALMTTDIHGDILRTNMLADDMFQLKYIKRDPEGAPVKEKGARLNIKDIEGLSKVITIDDITSKGGNIHNVAFEYAGKHSQKRGLVSIKPVMSAKKINGYLYTFTEYNQILSVVDAVSGSQLPTSFEDILGDGKLITQIKGYAQSISKGGSTILIQGETGTGKELFARAIHNQSSRSNEPFVAINCAAIPESLIESELFGYDDGAFTGAKMGGKIGKFELARKGTIFLDEIGDMPLNLQTKLLRVLQESTIERIGGTKTIPVDVRVIAATNKDLELMVDEREFRKDLFYRLNVMPLHLPPLKDRYDDILVLSKCFLDKYAKKFNKSYAGFDDEVIQVLQDYDWPGNIRELENAVEYMINVSQGPWIVMADLPRRIRPSGPKSDVEMAIRPLEEIEREHILNAMRVYKNADKAAQALGLGRATLFRKMKKYKEVH